MNWNDFELTWRHQALPVGAEADLATLRDTFESRRRKSARTLLFRDLTEATAGLLIAAVFATAGWHLHQGRELVVLSVLLVLGVTGFFVRERFRAKRLRLSSAAPVLARLDAEIAELEHQRRLLWNIHVWYLAPIVLAWSLFGVAGILEAAAHPAAREVLLHPFSLTVGAAYIVVCAVLFWAVWAVNRRTVRRQIAPRLLELQKLRQDLTISG